MAAALAVMACFVNSQDIHQYQDLYRCYIACIRCALLRSEHMYDSVVVCWLLEECRGANHSGHHVFEDDKCALL